MLDKRDELKDRVEAKRHELMAKFNELKADTRHEAIETRNKLKKKLDDLERYVKAGWENLDASLRSKLDKWLEHD